MQNKEACHQCGIEAGQWLLSGFFPVSESYLQHHPEQQAHSENVRLNHQGLCQYCQAFADHKDSAILNEELRYFVQSSAQQPVVVALSGGKDSLTALYLAVQLGLRPRCLMYQNGFIPDAVVQATQKHCQQLGVTLDIIEETLQGAFTQEYTLSNQQITAQTGMDFCGLCSQKLNQIARTYMHTHQARWLLFGNKTYARLSPQVSALRRHQSNEDFFYYSLNFLFLLRIKWPQQQKILQEMGWQDPGLSGYTSNCLIPGFVTHARQRKLGYHPEQSYLAMERRSGSYTAHETEDLLTATEASETQTIEHLQAHFAQQGWRWPQ